MSSILLRPLSIRRFIVSSCWSCTRRFLFTVALLGLLFLMPVVSLAQSQVTQRIDLEEGWNLVSLRVVPQDSSFEEVFQVASEEIKMIKDESGHVYYPAEDVRQISQWSVRESYEILVSSSLTVEVTGTPVHYSSKPIPLQEGWNFVPYFPAEAQKTSLATASIEDNLVSVVDEEGRAYDPHASSGSSAIDSLRPGHGYKLYVESADSLIYPVVAETIDEALALDSVAVGGIVRVLHHSEPGDGGGGLFKVTNTGCETDGGTCFIFDNDLSDKQTDTFTRFWGSDKTSLSHSNISWRTFQFRYGGDPNDVIPALHLHASGTDGDMTARGWRWMNLKNGTVGGGDAKFGRIRAVLGTDDYENDRRGVFTYRFATSPVRLERLDVSESTNPAWWGAPQANPEDPVDATPYIQWALNKAYDLRRKNNLDWAYVDIDGEYYWNHVITLMDGVMLRGTGSLNEDGFTRGTMTVTPDQALYSQRNAYDPEEMEDYYAGFHGQYTQITHNFRASKVGMRDLEINGNLQNNMGIYTSPDEYPADIGKHLQDSGNWNGFYTSGSGAMEYPDGMIVYMENIYAHDFGANIFGQAGGTMDVRSSNVTLKNSIRNHLFYSQTGTMTDWTIEGYSWAAMTKLGTTASPSRKSTYNNLTAKNLSPNPTGGEDTGLKWGNIFNVVGDTEVNGFTIDLRGSSNNLPTQGFKPTPEANGNYYRNGLIHVWSHMPFSLVGGPGVPQPSSTFDGVDVYDHGGGFSITRGDIAHGGLVIRNLTVQSGDGVTSPTSIAPIRFYVRAKRELVSRAHSLVVDGADWQRQFNNGLAKIGAVFDDALAQDVWILDSEFSNVGDVIIDDRQSLSGMDWRYPRLYLSNTTLNVPVGVRESNVPTFHEVLGRNVVGDSRGAVRLRNCQDRNGRISDSVDNTFTSDEDDEGNDYVLIPTDLMSRPGQINVRLVSSPPGIDSIRNVQVANADGNLRAPVPTRLDQHDPYLKVILDDELGSGEAITIDWTARVTPLNEYRTKGLFVSRPLRDTSLTSSSTPVTFDLRGVVANQADLGPITYSASSADGGVVAANIGEDGYTLELNKIGAGTSTVTVTAQQDGFGTIQTRFQVFVE